MTTIGAFSKLARDVRAEVAWARAHPPEENALQFRVPVRTQSEANMREPWRARAGRMQRQRQATRILMRGLASQLEAVKAWPSWRVMLVRVARARLDDDNLRGALKAVRDQVTQELGIGKWSVPKKAGVKSRFLPDDRDPRLSFAYGEDADRGNEYAVLVRIEKGAA